MFKRCWSQCCSTGCQRSLRCQNCRFFRCCTTCCCSNLPCQETNSGNVETLCYCSRYVDVPMHTYCGSDACGCSNCCAPQVRALQEISETLKSCCC